MTVSPAGRAFYIGAIVLSLGVGALQMFHVRAGFLTNYGADIFGTAWLYAIFRQGKTLYPRRHLSPELSSAVVFFGCAASELGQLWRVVPGTFDSMDLVAYAATVAACWIVDRRIASLA